MLQVAIDFLVFIKHFSFKQFFWRIKESGHMVDKGVPKISAMFYGLPVNLTNIDATYERNAGTKSVGITIFIGKRNQLNIFRLFVQKFCDRIHLQEYT